MKRYFIFVVAALVAASFTPSLWSQAGGGVGGGATASGSATGSAGAGASASGAVGSAGSPSTVGNAGAGNNVGAAGSAQGAGQNPVGQFGANNSNFNTIPQRPFFSDPGVRQQLNLNDTQYNALNRAYMNAYNRYNQGLSGLGTNTARDTTTQRNANSSAIRRNATNNATTQRERVQDFRSRVNNNTDAGVNSNTNVVPNNNTNTGVANNANAAAATNANRGAAAANVDDQRARQLQALQDRFNSDFTRSLDQTLTDPQLRRRYDQLYRQYSGFQSFNDPTTQQQLRLTADQRGQLRQLESEWRRQMTDWRRQMRNDDPAVQQQWSQLHSQYMDQLNSILTPQQQQSWTGMVGQPYEFPYQTYFPPNETASESENVLGTEQSQPDATQATQPPVGENTLR